MRQLFAALRQRGPDMLYWARVHFFRFWTATAVVVLFGLCFWYAPEFLTWWQKTVLGLIDNGSGMLPYPWSNRIAFLLTNFGASIWFQFTLAIILFRVLLWPFIVLFRRRRRAPDGTISFSPRHTDRSSSHS
jgi:hypothetical protein